MGELDKKLIEELKRRLPEDIAPHVRRMILYGSRARGDAPEDSDLDLVALVDVKTPELEQVLDDLTYNLMWDHDFKPVISLKVFCEEKFVSAVDKGLSFYRHVQQEGIVI